MELGARQQLVEQFDRRLHAPGREPRRDRQAVPVRRRPRRQRRRVHVVRVRAVHAEQRAAIQHVPGAGQLHEIRQEPFAHVRRRRREVPLRERVLPRQAERLRLQRARRLPHRRERVSRESESHLVAGHAPPLPGSLHEHSRPRQTGPAIGRVLHERVRAG